MKVAETGTKKASISTGMRRRAASTSTGIEMTIGRSGDERRATVIETESGSADEYHP